MSAATSSIVALGDSVAIVSGGLDWEHKQLRAIYGLKQKSEFKYINIVYDLIPINLPHYVVPHYVNLLTNSSASCFGRQMDASVSPKQHGSISSISAATTA